MVGNRTRDLRVSRTALPTELHGQDFHSLRTLFNTTYNSEYNFMIDFMITTTSKIEKPVGLRGIRRKELLSSDDVT